jgi:NAD(P)-dependent dehydrogenase (short-subunit alcohol dehydrogenase family)
MELPGLVDGKVALITGGSSGIGRGTALVFAREGAKVAIADIQVEQGHETVRLVKEAGGEAIFVKCDVSDSSEVKASIETVAATYGRLDCGFNNAGIQTDTVAKTADMPEEDFDRVISVNLKGVWLCMKYELALMQNQGSGAIVNTASTNGFVGMQGMGNYNASKGGVIMLTRTAALEYAKSGIRVNAVVPGGTDTPISRRMVNHPMMRHGRGAPMRRWARPQEIGEAVVWLCSDAASFVTGHAMAVDGGFLAA